MPQVDNLTPFHAVDLLSMDRHGHKLLVVCVAGRFTLPRGGKPLDGEPPRAEVQLPPVLEDEYFDDPETSSLKYEGQTAYMRPGTDIVMQGQARSTRGRSTTALKVELRVGRCHKTVLVIGDRVWQRRLGSVTPSEPAPFTSMPLRYERAFGGRTAKTWEARNPVGCGLYEDAAAADGRPLPNLEDPKQRIQSLRDRPPPAGFGPIARHWKPRVDHAGTYDDEWVETRAPLWPRDFDERFFLSASPGLASSRPLVGGEPVHLFGVSPHGAIDFRLPQRRLGVKGVFQQGELHRLMTIDTVLFDLDEDAVTVIWRTALPVQERLHLHEVTVVRTLEAWEEPKV